VARVTSNSVYRTTTSYPAELKATRYEGIASLLLVDLNGIA